MQTAHSSQDTFDKLINLVTSCGEKHLVEQQWMHPTPHQMPSLISWRLSQYGDDLQAYLLPDAPFFCVMAAECTDIATVEELRHFCLGVENESSVEHFLGILPLKEGNAEYICST